MLNFRGVVLVTALVVAATIPCRADLVGTQVTGTLSFPGWSSFNFFDPGIFGGALHLVPPSGLNNTQGPTVTISATGTEFAYTDGSNAITADFTGTQLLVTDLSTGSTGWTMTFTDTSFAGLSLNAPSSLSGLTYSSAGDVLTINWAGTASSSQPQPLYSAAFDVVDPPPTGSGVPEPGSALYLFAALPAIGFWARSRKRVA